MTYRPRTKPLTDLDLFKINHIFDQIFKADFEDFSTSKPRHRAHDKKSQFT